MIFDHTVIQMYHPGEGGSRRLPSFGRASAARRDSHRYRLRRASTASVATASAAGDPAPPSPTAALVHPQLGSGGGGGGGVVPASIPSVTFSWGHSAAHFAVSVEAAPAASGAAPSSPYVLSGACVKLW